MVLASGRRSVEQEWWVRCSIALRGVFKGLSIAVESAEPVEPVEPVEDGALNCRGEALLPGRLG